MPIGALTGMNELLDSRFLNSIVSEVLMVMSLDASVSFLIVLPNIAGVARLMLLAVVPLCENGPLTLLKGKPILGEHI
jgi:hypothetical protein